MIHVPDVLPSVAASFYARGARTYGYMCYLDRHNEREPNKDIIYFFDPQGDEVGHVLRAIPDSPMLFTPRRIWHESFKAALQLFPLEYS